MESKWKEAKLSNVIEIKYGKDHKKLNEGNIPCYGTGGIMRMVDKYIYENESILIPRKGSLNNIYYMTEPFWTVDTIFWTKINQEKVFPKFLFYQLSKIDFVSLNVGSAVPSLTVPVLNDINIKLPPLPEQKAIAQILSSLDDKIELNRQINQTLEQMAEAMFKSWFVDFDPVFDNAIANNKAIPKELKAKAEKRRMLNLSKYGNNKKTLPKEIQELFPDEFELTEEMGFVPKGWKIDIMKNLFEIGSAKRIFAKEYQEEGIPFFRGKEITQLSNGGSFKSEVYISYDKYLEINNKYEVPKLGDILLTSVGTLGNTYLVKDGDEFYFKDGNLTWFKGYKSIITPEFLKTWFDSNLAKKAIEDITIGSTQQAITINSLNSISFLISSEKIINYYTKIVKSNNLRINKNQKQTEKLIKLRDTLLPKLISGELRVPEKLIEKE